MGTERDRLALPSAGRDTKGWPTSSPGSRLPRPHPAPWNQLEIKDRRYLGAVVFLQNRTTNVF